MQQEQNLPQQPPMQQQPAPPETPILPQSEGQPMAGVQPQAVQPSPSVPKKGRSKKMVLIVVVVGIALLLIAAVGVFYWFVTRKPVETPQEEGEVSQPEYEGWKMYESEEYGFSFKYPSDWELEDKLDCDEYPDDCSVIKVSKDESIWEMWLDPMYTGGGFGYVLDMVLPPSEIVEIPVTPAGYDAAMVARFVTDTDFPTDFIESGAPSYNFGENAWGWSVLFTKDEQGEYTVPGFGPGDMLDNIEGNYFAIVYKYDSQEDDLSDLPHRGEEELGEMFEIMDKITNSFLSASSRSTGFGEISPKHLKIPRA